MSTGVNRRRALVMADQGASSLSNMLVGVFVARALSPDGFGAFGLGWVAYLLALGACRALVGEPLLSRYSHEPVDRRVLRTPDLLGATLTVSLVFAGVVALVGLVLSGPPATALLAVALVLPIVLLEDAWRFMFIIDRPLAALAVDLTWLAGVLIAVSRAPADAGAGWYMTAWGVSAVPAVVLAAALERVDLSSVRPLRWLAEERETGARFFGEFLTAQAAAQVTLAALGGIAGMAALGGVRSSQIIYGPLNTIHAGIYLAVVPDGAKTRDDPSRLRRLSLVATVIIVASALVWMIVCLALPDSVGHQLFKESWAEGRDLLAPMGLAMIAGSAATGGFAGVRSLGDSRLSMRARLQSLPGELALPLAGGLIGGAVGFTVGFLVARILTSIVWWRAFIVGSAMERPIEGADVAVAATLARTR